MRRPWLLWSWLALAALAWIAIVWSAERSYRRADWPHWQTVEVDGLKCSVRVHVLRRDALRRIGSQPDVDTLDDDPCAIVGGLWVDRYTGQPLGDPKGIDIDHVISLAEAHARGGSQWTRARRAEYANFLGYRHHLAVTSASVNRAKGAKGADQWVPDDPAQWCQFGEARAVIAVLFALEVSEAELAAIRRLVATC